MERGRPVRIIDSPQAASDLFAPLFVGVSHERLCVAYLNAASALLDVRIHDGTEKGAVDFPVRAIIADAFALDSAALVLAHNHPSGDPAPTASDIEATRLLARTARPLDIAVRDHLIFGGGRAVSFRERGLL
jgi:DNA repair protein RadC